MPKKLLGGALQIGSAAIPLGGAGAAGAKIGQQILQKSLGKKLAQEIGSGITSGAVAGGVFGAGQGLINDENPLKTAAKDAAIGGVIGGISGGLSGKFLQDAKIKILNELTEKRKDWGIAFRKASGNTQKAIDTLLERQKGFVPDAFNKSGIGKGDIVWGKSGKDGYGLAHIIERRNSEGINGEEFIKQIPNDIASGNVNKNHENLGRFYIENTDNNIVIRNDYNKKPRNWLVTAYEKYDKNNSQAISGRQTSKNSFPNEQHIPSSDLGSKAIIPNNFNNFNPSHVAIPTSPIFTGSVQKNVDINGNEINLDFPIDSNRIFTREDIASMTGDEYLQNENAINSQWGKIGIPTNGDMEREMITNGNIVYADYIGTTNDKPKRLDAINFDKLSNTKNNVNYEYLIRNNSNQSGKDFYQIKKVGSASAYSNQNRALETKSINIIPNNFNNFNPSHVAIPTSSIFTGSVSKNVDLNGNELTNLPFDSNRIFTREDIASMTGDEYLQNEDAIKSQWGKIGIPTNGDMEREMITNGNIVYVKPYTRQDGTKVKGYYRSLK